MGREQDTKKNNNQIADQNTNQAAGQTAVQDAGQGAAQAAAAGRNEHHKLITVLTVILTVILAAVIFLVIWYWGDSYPDFKDMDEAAAIPGLDEGATPQGMDVYKPTSGTYSGENMMLVAANMKDGSARIYVTGETSGYIGYVPVTVLGVAFTGEISGIATNGRSIWMASGSTVYSMAGSSSGAAANDIITKAAANGEALYGTRDDGTDTDDNDDDDGNGDDRDIVDDVEIIARAGSGNVAYADDADASGSYELQSFDFTGSFDANCTVGFLSMYSTTKLYVGENSASGADDTHKVTTTNGDENLAFVYEYNTSTSSTSAVNGLTALTDGYDADGNSFYVPKIQAVYSIPGNIAGFARTSTSTQLVLCENNGYVSSSLLCYKWSSVTSSSSTYVKTVGSNFTYNGLYKESKVKYTDNPKVYFAESSKLNTEYKIPALAGNIALGSDYESVYVLFRSAVSPYSMLARQQVKDIYTFTYSTER